MPREPFFRFRFDRSLQASGYLLKWAGGEMHFLHLLKLLYIADREYLATFGEMITGDRVFAMKRGPVLKRVYDLIKGDGPRADDWARFIQTFPRSHKVRLVADPGTLDLCRASESVLDHAFGEYYDMDRFDLSEFTHTFPEWEKFQPETNGGRARLIPWSEILIAQGRADMIPAGLESIKVDGYQQDFRKLLHEAR